MSKQSNGGEPKKKKSQNRHHDQGDKEYLADAQDGKRANVGPSGQGPHRGRERSNRQTAASGRPNIHSIGNTPNG